jgi:hypothetical protein
MYQLVESENLAKDYRAKDQLIGSAGELPSQLFLLLSAGKIDEQTYQENYLDLIDLSSELKGLIKYLNEFETKKRRIYSTDKSSNIPIFNFSIVQKNENTRPR